MTKKKQEPQKSGQIFTMTGKEAAYSFASLVYHYDQIEDDVLKADFEQEWLNGIFDHATGGVRKPHEDVLYKMFDEKASKGDKIRAQRQVAGFRERINVYEKDGKEKSLSWILTYASALICKNKGDNPLASHFMPHLQHMFADPKQALAFQGLKPKMIAVQKEGFSWKSLFHMPSKEERQLKELEGKVTNFFRNDAFAQAMEDDRMCDPHYLETFRKNLSDFAHEVTPLLKAMWQESDQDIVTKKKPALAPMGAPANKPMPTALHSELS